MTERRIIPCLNIRGGEVVKGRFEKVRGGDPVQLAELYDWQNANELMIYDTDASLQNRIIDLDLIRRVSSKINIPLMVAGGILTVDDFERVFDVGASKVLINSKAIRNPKLIKDAFRKFGSGSVIVGIDAKRGAHGKYSVMMGIEAEIDSGLDLPDWVKMAQELGAGGICLNSLDADKKENGYDIDMINAITEIVDVPLIASGGCAKLEDFSELFGKTNANAALSSRVFHSGGLTVNGVKEYLRNLDKKFEE
jgi:imidazoleglycerol phosphate synthase cyclase subunit